ncbi:GAF and ANTAR domain-containing protein [Microbacteriaceae bacterium VKM Ac-2855]|nr:GAF and ANTAR domain-containing protein [Microbacteriaceae bacterium VKM Ac-2855]
MTDDPRERRVIRSFITVADTLIDHFDVVDLLHGLVQDCVDIVDVPAGGMLLADPRSGLQPVASTSERPDLIELLQLDAESGPSRVSYDTGQPVTVDDIDSARWRSTDFGTALTASGFGAVYCTPMRLRGTVIGSLTLFGAAAGALSSADLSVVRGLADVATISILQERLVRENHDVSDQLERALQSRVVIEQAKGMLAMTMGVGFGTAFDIMRRYARTNRMSLRETATRIVERRLIMQPQGLDQERSGTSS